MNRVTIAILARGERRSAERAAGAIAAEFGSLRLSMGLLFEQYTRVVEENRKLREVVERLSTRGGGGNDSRARVVPHPGVRPR